jgi:hypothetical protein
MTNSFNLPLGGRASALLCCSAAVLLSACGGGADSGNVPQAQLAGHMASSEVAPGPIVAALPSETPSFSDAQAPEVEDSFSAPALFDIEASVGATDGPQAARQEAAPLANTYHLYVATTGSDSNPGSQSRPFRTIQRAANLAKPSTTVHVAPGTYRENVKTGVSGKASARIRYVSDRKWAAKVIGSGTEAMWANTADYTDIVGFDISGSGRLGILNRASYALMARNHVHHLTISGGCNDDGGAGINNGNYSSSDGDIIGNVVHDIGVPGKCSGVHGIYSSNLRGRINNNIVYRVSAYGIHLWHAADRVVVANNTVFANGAEKMGGGIIFGVGDKPGGVVMDHTRVINNIVYGNPAASIRQYCYPGVNCLGKHNIVANNLVHGNGSKISMLVGRAEETVTDDPEFVNYQANGRGDYRLRSTSPARNKGTASFAPKTDIVGTARPRGAAHDIGAYESN